MFDFLTFMQCGLSCHLVINLMILAWLYTVFHNSKVLSSSSVYLLTQTSCKTHMFHNNKFVSARRPTPLTDHFSSFYLNRVFLKSFQLDQQVDLLELWLLHTLLWQYLGFYGQYIQEIASTKFTMIPGTRVFKLIHSHQFINHCVIKSSHRFLSWGIQLTSQSHPYS